MESDDRFVHLAKDPRFKILRKKQKKVQIDDRFKSMFTDEKFTLKYTKDKRGRKQNKTSSDDLKKYYSLEDDELAKHDPEQEVRGGVETQSEVKVSDEPDVSSPGTSSDSIDEEVESQPESGSKSEDESDLSSSSDESESDVESNEDDEVDIDKITYDWQPLDHDAETAEATSKRLAIQNLDWDHLDVRDIYTLVNSIRPPMSVRIYLSEFGKERLKEEEIHGPKELVEVSKDDEEEEVYQELKEKMDALNSVGPKLHKINEYEDADEEMNPKDEELREKIRKYQLSRMKYYYAVIEFDSIESAELVYKELDGKEYEGSSLELDLRFIPDDVEFDQEDIKSECSKLPDPTTYKAPLFINTALQQTNVKFTWDETDLKRQEKLHRAYTKEELEKDDLDAYLASETDSEEEEGNVMNFDDSVSVVTANSEARVNKYKMLLRSIEEEAEKKKKVDVDVEWGNFSEEEKEVEDDVGKEMEENEDSDVEDDESSASRQQQDQDMRESSKRRGKKSKRRNNKRKDRGEEAEDREEGDELDLLVLDADNTQRGEFEFDPDDPRFKAVYDSGLYNIDPSHPNFKPTKAFDMIAEKKREKRQKTRSLL